MSETEKICLPTPNSPLPGFPLRRSKHLDMSLATSHSDLCKAIRVGRFVRGPWLLTLPHNQPSRPFPPLRITSSQRQEYPVQSGQRPVLTASFLGGRRPLNAMNIHIKMRSPAKDLSAGQERTF